MPELVHNWATAASISPIMAQTWVNYGIFTVYNFFSSSIHSDTYSGVIAMNWQIIISTYQH